MKIRLKSPISIRLKSPILIMHGSRSYLNSDGLHVVLFLEWNPDNASPDGGHGDVIGLELVGSCDVIG